MERIIESLRKVMQRTLVYPSGLGVQLMVGIMFTAFVFGFLSYYTPFNLNELGSERFIPSMVFALITGVVIVISFVLAPFIWPGITKRGGFTNLHLLALSFLTMPVIALLNWLYASNSEYSMVMDVNWNYMTLLMDIVYFPGFLIANLVDWEHRQLIIVDLPFLESETTLSELEQDTPMISLVGLDDKVLLEVREDQFLAAFSSQNYSEIVVLDQGVAHTHLIRLTFGHLQEQLIRYPQFIRCHRTRIINLRFVTGIITDDGKKFIRLKHLEEAIPVSRQYPIEDHFPSLKQKEEP